MSDTPTDRAAVEALAREQEAIAPVLRAREAIHRIDVAMRPDLHISYDADVLGNAADFAERSAATLRALTAQAERAPPTPTRRPDMRSQHRVTVKVTLAGEEPPTYYHFEADNFDHPNAQDAMKLYRRLVDDASLAVVKVEIYKETHVYSMALWDRWERPDL